MAAIPQGLPDLGSRESEPLARVLGEDVVHHDIVQIREDALLRYLHHTGQIGHLHVRIGLQRRAEEIAEEIERLPVGFVPEIVGHGAVVLVDEDYRLLPRGFEYRLGQVFHGRREEILLDLPPLYGLEQVHEIRIDVWVVQEILVGSVCVPDGCAHPVDERPVGSRLRTVQVEVDHREGVLVPLELGILGDRQPVEPRVALVLDVEERVQHGKIGGLPEPAGTREQIGTPVVEFEEILDQERLVDVIHVVLAEIRERHPAQVYLLHAINNLSSIDKFLHREFYSALRNTNCTPRTQ